MAQGNIAVLAALGLDESGMADRVGGAHVYDARRQFWRFFGLGQVDGRGWEPAGCMAV
jgi:hypothetical protein